MQKFPIQALKDWFRSSARDLPWRHNTTPYRVWISEVMLQQTQAAVVKEYYLAWMEKFPTIEALAGASLEEVIKAWEGLGYYSRARNIHAAAKMIMQKYGGIFPSLLEELSTLKGLGPYTIGAILSFAFHKKAAAVDGNVVRVLTRYFAIQEDVGKSSTMKKVWDLAEAILPDSEPWIAVEALIELGASICKKQPLCWTCPLQEGCAGCAQKLQDQLPHKTKKIAITALKRFVFVITHGESFLVKQEKEGNIMASLYQFPYSDAEVFPFSFEATKMKTLPAVKHSFTRYRATLLPTLWKAINRIEVPGYHWVERLKQYPFSSGHRKIVSLIEE